MHNTKIFLWNKEKSLIEPQIYVYIPVSYYKYHYMYPIKYEYNPWHHMFRPYINL